MEKSLPNYEAIRLTKAADAILLARERNKVGAKHPPSEEGFTPVELVDAFLFLQRLSLVDAETNLPKRKGEA
jgi:hypothetical protein